MFYCHVNLWYLHQQCTLPCGIRVRVCFPHFEDSLSPSCLQLFSCLSIPSLAQTNSLVIFLFKDLAINNEQALKQGNDLQIKCAHYLCSICMITFLRFIARSLISRISSGTLKNVLSQAVISIYDGLVASFNVLLSVCAIANVDQMISRSLIILFHQVFPNQHQMHSLRV